MIISQAVFAPIQILVPNIRLGIANLVILLFIYRFKTYEGAIAAVLKSIIVGFIAGGGVRFLIGFSGTILSFTIMKILQSVLKSDKSIIFVSLIGAVTHTIGQVLMAFLLYGFGKETFGTGIFA